MTITKMYQIITMFFLTYKRSLAQSANSQQPTANSQQPTANSQQPTANSQQPTANSQTLTKIIFYFTIQNFLLIRAVSEIGVFSHFILWLLFFYAYLAVRLRSLTGRQKEILKQVQDDRSHTDSKSLRDFFEVKK